MKIGEEVYIHGYIDEIRRDTVIIRNDGGYFGTIPSEIKALEQQPSDDCVSRQALLEFVESKYQSNWWNVDEVLAKIKAMTPVTPTHKQGEWINIKKQLPPIGLDVLICDIDGDIYLTHRTEYVGHNSWNFYDESGNQIKDVRAWQPLPKPYEEKRGDENELN